MTPITLQEFYMGRDKTYPKELTPILITNAIKTVACTNSLLTYMEADGVDISKRKVNSGWRPKSVNTATPGADPNSCHITCEAIDLGDINNKFKLWVRNNAAKVKSVGFFATEDFSLTKTWLHLQTRDILSWQKGRAILVVKDNLWVNRATGLNAFA